ncbi:MAG: hypothetical protein ACLRQ0_11585 [Monoglobales bacterium]
MALIEILAIASFCKAIDNSLKMDEKALKKIGRAYNRECEARELLSRKKEEADNAITKLINRKKAIISTSINDFVEMYSVIKKINFIEGEGIKELKKDMTISEDISAMKQMTLTAVGSVKMTDKDVVKAFLMGGLIGASAISDSKQNLKAANNQMRSANVMYSQAQTAETALNGIIDRCNNFSELLVKLNIIFIRSIKECLNTVARNGEDKSSYTQSDRAQLMTCVNIASAVKSLLDVPILDSNGEITQKSYEALQTGREYLDMINNL